MNLKYHVLRLEDSDIHEFKALIEDLKGIDYIQDTVDYLKDIIKRRIEYNAEDILI